MKPVSDIQGTFVTKVFATDNDEAGTINAKIAYAIVKQDPEDEGMMFYIEKNSGKVLVKETNLDREVIDFYTLTITATDLDGAAKGNVATGTVEIKVLDINDNPPRLEKEQYSGSIDENAVDVEVMRIKALDDDLVNTDNWLADFKIKKGNEDGHFTLETDPKTNEGILKLVKVNDLPDGPTFSPTVKPVPVSEDPKEIKIPSVIATYPALDGDTGELAENVRYAKGYDPDNWLSIDEKTAEISLIKMPDRESKHLVDGIYYAKILCLTQDMPPKTATGTIALNVQDSNDHCPHLSSTYRSLCAEEKTVYVSAIDEDGNLNGAPFEFLIVPEETTGEWDVEHVLELDVCTCAEGGICGLREAQAATKKLAGLGVGVLLLGFLALLAVPFLLMFCFCGKAASGLMPGGFADLPMDAKEYLIPYHTEGKGEDKEFPLLSAPFTISNQEAPIVAETLSKTSAARTNVAVMDGGMMFGNADGGLLDLSEALDIEADGSLHRRTDSALQKEVIGIAQREEYERRPYSGFREDDGDPYVPISLSEDFLEEYYSQVSN
ncbi:hypothetical protein SKAU_G00074170 [Synaphobranchus kaupii]|uniref:Cadherin domain-containing protein n=1 Tax=Synaphobranchus kaupii TaxID=118154 RepID=A0A9Q1G7C9_SYNKA|nr:hypothetical protein SKAU_G00074170 [Synaphobranchus kaupii]